jgi:hypothetical protein
MKACIQAATDIDDKQKEELLRNYDEMLKDALASGKDPISAETAVIKALLDSANGKLKTNIVKARQAVMMKHIEKELLDQLKREEAVWEEAYNRVPAFMRDRWAFFFRRPTQGKVYRDLLQSVENRRNSLQARYMSELGKLYDEIGEKEVLSVLNSQELMQDVYRAMMGHTSRYGNVNKVAKAFRRILDRQVKDRWAAGALANKMDDFTPQRWESSKFDGTAANRTKFREDALRRFTWNDMIDPKTGKTFQVGDAPSAREKERIDEFINEMYEDVHTDGARADWRIKQEGKIPGKDRREIYQPDVRIVKMTDPDDFFYMNEEWGWGNDNLLNLMMAHIEGQAADIAMMQRMGPMVNDTHLYFSKGYPDQYSAMSDMMFTTLSRSYSGPANLKRHGYLVAGHSLLRSSLLGQAILAAPSDIVIAGQVASMNGLRSGAVGTGLDYMRNFFTTGMRSNDRVSAIAMQNSHIISQSILDATLEVQRYGGEAAIGPLGKGARTLNKMSTMTMKLSGLQKATTDLADTLSMAFSGDLGSYVKGGARWNTLPDDFRKAAMFHGIDEGRWNNQVLKGRPHSNRGDDWFLDYRTIPDVETGRRIADWDAALRTTATNSPDLRLRTVVSGGANLGTWRRAATSSIFLFKSWPIQILRNVSLPLVNMAMQGKIPQLAMVASSLFVTGIVTVQLKNLANGKDFEEWSSNLATRAFLAGGLGGIIFDLAVQDQGYHNSIARKLGGPTIGLAEDVFSVFGALSQSLLDEGDQTLGKEVLRVTNRYTPLGNLWFANAAVDRLIYNTLHQLPGVDPGFYERRANIDQKLLNEKGQGYFWDSTSSLQNP